MTESELRDDLPPGWDVRRLKTVAELRSSNVDKNRAEDERPVRLCNYTDVYYSDEIVDANEFMEATATPAEIEKFRLRRADVLLTKDSETADDIAVPAYVARDFDDVLCGYHLALVRPTMHIDGKFFFYALLTDRIGDQFAIGANGITRFGLSLDVLKNALLPVPPLPIQRAVADFLDRETAKIDTLIEKKRRLLDLLDEKRTALITRAVTRGLDPDVPMKDSGVEWIGEIPEHWEVTKLCFIAKDIQTGPFGAQLGSDDYVDGEVPVINPANIRKHGLVPDQSKTIERTFAARLGRYRLEPGDVVFARRGQLGRCGRVVPDQSGWICGTGCLRVRSKHELLDSRFLVHYADLPGIPEWLSRESVGSTMDNLNTELLGNMPVVLPPMAEQEEIARYAEEQAGRLEDIGERIAKAISLLREYRSALITAAVTGKIDVHEKIPA